MSVTLPSAIEPSGCVMMGVEALRWVPNPTMLADTSRSHEVPDCGRISSMRRSRVVPSGSVTVTSKEAVWPGGSEAICWSGADETTMPLVCTGVVADSVPGEAKPERLEPPAAAA